MDWIARHPRSARLVVGWASAFVIVLALLPGGVSASTISRTSPGYAGTFSNGMTIWSGTIKAGETAYLTASGTMDQSGGGDVRWNCGAFGGTGEDWIGSRAWIIAPGAHGSATLAAFDYDRFCRFIWRVDQPGASGSVTVDYSEVRMDHDSAYVPPFLSTPNPSASIPAPTGTPSHIPFVTPPPPPTPSASACFGPAPSPSGGVGGGAPVASACPTASASPSGSPAFHDFDDSCGFPPTGTDSADGCYGADTIIVYPGDVWSVTCIMTDTYGGYSSSYHEGNAWMGTAGTTFSTGMVPVCAMAGSALLGVVTHTGNWTVVGGAPGSVHFGMQGGCGGSCNFPGNARVYMDLVTPGDDRPAPSSSPSGSGGPGASGAPRVCYISIDPFTTVIVPCPAGTGVPVPGVPGTNPGGNGGPCVPGPLSNLCKPGIGGYGSGGDCAFPWPSLNPLDYFGWIGCEIINVQTAIANAVQWLINAAIDAVMPSDAIFVAIDGFLTTLGGTFPFSIFGDIISSIQGAGGSAGSLPDIPLPGGDSIPFPVDLMSEGVAPFRGLMAAGVYLGLSLALLRWLLAMVGVSRGGGGDEE